jgi:hypothetical protein
MRIVKLTLLFGVLALAGCGDDPGTRAVTGGGIGAAAGVAGAAIVGAPLAAGAAIGAVGGAVAGAATTPDDHAHHNDGYSQ